MSPLSALGPDWDRVSLLTCPQLVIASLLAGALVLHAGEPERTTVLFRSGENGYHTYRIPALFSTPSGAVLAFCEGRKHSAGDSGDIDIVLRRSSDRGRTWSPLSVIADHGPDTIGNPAPVFDRATGTLWLLLTGNPGSTAEREIMRTGAGGTRTVWIMSSRDDGRTWTPPREITSAVKRAGWRWYATGPGSGIGLRSGRLVVPCNHSEGDRPIRSHVIYSDDHGRSWQIGGSLPEKTDECAVAELRDGTLLLNMRNTLGRHRRAVARSRDGGLTWSELSFDETLIDPACQGSLIRAGRRLVFSNAADERRRIRMTVRASLDGGRSWPVSTLLYEGPSAYSSLALLKGGAIGILYERGASAYYETVTYQSLSTLC
jgi:sialidase-1